MSSKENRWYGKMSGCRIKCRRDLELGSYPGKCREWQTHEEWRDEGHRSQEKGTIQRKFTQVQLKPCWSRN